MAKERHLNNAPIAEAIIDFRVKLSSDFKIQKFESLKEELRDRYPKSEESHAFAGGIEIKKGKLSSTTVKDMGLKGYFFKSADEKQIAQFKNDGFTFNRLKPYTRWEEIIKEAKSLWGIYVDKASPELVTRIAVRYINRLEIPFKTDDFSYYLAAPPSSPPDLPSNIEVEGFFNRIVIRDLKQDIKSNIIQALEKGVDPKFRVIILDIDVYKIHDYNIDDKEIWETFEKLRDMKNHIFFNSLTDETVRLFE